jgi:hypothetical protein
LKNSGGTFRSRQSEKSRASSRSTARTSWRGRFLNPVQVENLQVANLIELIYLLQVWNLKSSQLELDLRTALWGQLLLSHLGANFDPAGVKSAPGVKLAPRGEIGPQGWSRPPGVKLAPRGEDRLFTPPFFRAKFGIEWPSYAT